jgi:subtilisin family serine protease
MKKKNYTCKKPNPTHAIDCLKKPTNYSLQKFGFKNLSGDGLGIKICVIDTGLPRSSHLQTTVRNAIDFTDTNIYDQHGHATGVAGMLVARSPGNMLGLAPQATVFYAKAINNNGRGDHGAVQASILYSIVQGVDIILMSFGCESAHPSLKDAIKKAHNRGICIIAAAGNDRSQTKDADFPARLPEVLSVGLKTSKGQDVQNITADLPAIDLSINSLYTTYLNNKFIKMGGSSIAAPIAAAATACVIQQQKGKNTIINPLDVYKEVIHSLR